MNGQLGCKSKITGILDCGLATSGNVLIDDTTGSEKTAIVEAWMEEHEDELNGVFFSCSTLKSPAGKRVEHGDLLVTGQLFGSDTIDKMCEKDFVAVFDDWRLADDNLKQHILMLCDGFVVDERMPDGVRKLDTLRFVVCIGVISD